MAGSAGVHRPLGPAGRRAPECSPRAGIGRRRGRHRRGAARLAPRAEADEPAGGLLRRERLQFGRRLLAAGLLLAASLGGCRSTSTRPGERVSSQPYERGIASWYGPGFQGRRTANGEIFDTRKLTAAHQSLPFGTWIDVVNIASGRSVRVRVNDRGPFVGRRILDLTRAAADAIGMLGAGTAEVEIFIVEGNNSVPPVQLYTVQVAAFADRANAEALAARLSAAFPAAAVHSDGIWHRVQIDRFPTLEKAEAVRDRLLELGYQPLILGAP